MSGSSQPVAEESGVTPDAQSSRCAISRPSGLGLSPCRSRSCGLTRMYAPAEPALSLDLLLTSPRGDLPSLVAPWNPTRLVAFDSGKSALWGALRAACLGRGDELLVPAYVFHAVLDPALALGLTCRFYRVTTAIEPDLDDLTAKIGARTRALLLVHYFGFPGPSRALRQLCDERGLLLIEDCAHALFGSGGDGPLGSVGDLSVFSLKKILPVPGGGILVINNPNLTFTDHLSAPSARDVLSRLVGRILNSAEAVSGWSVKARLLSSHEFRRLLARRVKPRQARFDQGLNIISAAIARRVDPSEVTRRRRANYTRLLEDLPAPGWIRPVFPDLPRGVSPFCFPIYVENRDRVQDYLLRRGIHARVYWDVAELPAGALEQCPDTASILERILTLPIHQSIREEHIRRYCLALRGAHLIAGVT